MSFLNDTFGSGNNLDAMDEVALQAIHLERDYRKEIAHCKNLAIQIRNVDRELDQVENDSAASKKRKVVLPPSIEVIFSNVGSVSKSLQTVKEHIANLKKSLELEKIKTSEDTKRYVATMAHYKSLWDSYEAIYERRPIAMKRKEMKNRIKIENVTLARTKFKCKEITEKITIFTAVKEKLQTVRIIQMAKNYKERNIIFRQKADLKKMVLKLEGDIKEMTRERDLLFNAPVVSHMVTAALPVQKEIESQVTSVTAAAAPKAKTPRSEPLMFPSFELPKIQLPKMTCSPPKSRCFRDLRNPQPDGGIHGRPSERGYNVTDDGDSRAIARALAAGFSPAAPYAFTRVATSTPLRGLGQQSMEMGNVSTIAAPLELGSEVTMDTGDRGEHYSSSSIMMDSSEYDSTPMKFQRGGARSSHMRAYQDPNGFSSQETHLLESRHSKQLFPESQDGMAVVDVQGRRASWTKNVSQEHAVPMLLGREQEPSQQLMERGTPKCKRYVAEGQENLLGKYYQPNDQEMPKSQHHMVQAEEQQLVQHRQSMAQGTPRRQMAQEQEVTEHYQSIGQGMPSHQMAQEQEVTVTEHYQSIGQGMPSRQMAQEQEVTEHYQSIGQGMPSRQMAPEQAVTEHYQSIGQGMPSRQMAPEQAVAEHYQSIGQGMPSCQMAQEQQLVQHRRSIAQETPRFQMAQEQEVAEHYQSIGQGMPSRQMAQEQEVSEHYQPIGQETPRHQMAPEEEVAEHYQSIGQGMPSRQMAQEQEIAEHYQPIGQETPRHQMAQEQEVSEHYQPIGQETPRHQMAPEEEVAEHYQSVGQGMPRRQMAQEKEVAEHYQSIGQGMPSHQMTQEQQLVQHHQLIGQETHRRRMAPELEVTKRYSSNDQGMPGSKQHMVQAQELEVTKRYSLNDQEMPGSKQLVVQAQEQPMIKEHVVKPKLITQQIIEAHDSIVLSQQPTSPDADNRNDDVELNYSIRQTNEPAHQQSANQARKVFTVQPQDVPLESIQMDGTPLPFVKNPVLQSDNICQAKDVLTVVAQTEDSAVSFQKTTSQGGDNGENVEQQTEMNEYDGEQEEFPSKTPTNLSQTSQTQNMEEIMDANKRRAFLKQLMKSPDFNYLPRQMHNVQDNEEDVCEDDDIPPTNFLNSFMNFRNRDPTGEESNTVNQDNRETHRGDGDGVAYQQDNKEREARSQAYIGGGDAALHSTGASDGRDERGTRMRLIPPTQIMSRAQTTEKNRVVADDDSRDAGNVLATPQGRVGDETYADIRSDGGGDQHPRGHQTHAQGQRQYTPQGQQTHAQGQRQDTLRGHQTYSQGQVEDTPRGHQTYSQGQVEDTPQGHQTYSQGQVEDTPREHQTYSQGQVEDTPRGQQTHAQSQRQDTPRGHQTYSQGQVEDTPRGQQTHAQGQRQDTPRGHQTYSQGQVEDTPRGHQSYSQGQVEDTPRGHQTYSQGQVKDTPRGHQTYSQGQLEDTPQGHQTYSQGQLEDTPRGHQTYSQGQREQNISHGGGQGHQAYAQGQGEQDTRRVGVNESPYEPFNYQDRPEQVHNSNYSSPYLEANETDPWLFDSAGRAGGELGRWQSPTIVASPDMGATTPQDGTGFFNFGSNSSQPRQSTFSLLGTNVPSAASDLENRQPPNRSEVFTFNFDNKSNTPTIFKLF